MSSFKSTWIGPPCLVGLEVISCLRGRMLKTSLWGGMTWWCDCALCMVRVVREFCELLVNMATL